MHASFAHILKPTGRSWHCEDGPRSIFTWLRPSEMHTAVSESDLDHLGKWLRSKHGDLTASWSRIFPAHPARVALPDSERCPPKAEVEGSNPFGSATKFT